MYSVSPEYFGYTLVAPNITFDTVILKDNDKALAAT
jgi:hypothetical protein